MSQATEPDEPYSSHGAPDLEAIKADPLSTVEPVDDSKEHTTEVLAAAISRDKTAWSQVLASFLINMNLYGLVQSFGEFQHFYETEYLESYSSSAISWIGTVQGALMLMVGALAGPIFDKGYFKITLYCAAVGLVVSWMLLSVSDQYYQVSRTASYSLLVCMS